MGEHGKHRALVNMVRRLALATLAGVAALAPVPATKSDIDFFVPQEIIDAHQKPC